MGGLIPVWTKAYRPRALLYDMLAGFILSVLLVPQAMAYALLAGLPPEVGLYAAVAPPLAYLLLGASPYVSVGPVALVSLLVAEALGQVDMPAREAAMILALETGGILAIIGLLRLGRLVNFISEPALLGFTAAAAFLIAASQIPTLLGVDVERNGDLISGLAAIWGALDGTDLAALLLGIAALLLLVLGDRYGAASLWRMGVHPPYRQALVKAIPLAVLIFAAIAATTFSLDIDKVGHVEGGLPRIALASIGDPQPWIALLPASFVNAVVIFVLGMAVAKSLARRERRSLTSDREAIALGTGNLLASVTGGYPVGVSLSRSALTYESGARSPVASALGGAIVLLILLFFSDLLAPLPKTALAALVISAVFGLVRTREIAAVWRLSKIEGMVFLAAFASTLLFGVQWGLVAGAGAGIAAFLWSSSLPRVTRVGATEDGERVFRSIDRDEVEIDTMPILVVRIDRSLYFANAAYCEDRLMEHLARHPDARCLLLDMRAVNSVDASGLAMLERLLGNAGEKDLKVSFAAVHEPVERALRESDPARQCEFYKTVEEAIRRIEC